MMLLLIRSYRVVGFMILIFFIAAVGSTWRARCALAGQPKIEAAPGQWTAVSGIKGSYKLAWQYTPGDSEFLAIVFGCDSRTRTGYVLVDGSEEKAGDRIDVKITKGTRLLDVRGRVEDGESGPFVKARVAGSSVAQLLDQPGDVVLVLPHHRLSFSANSFAGPYAKFANACRLREGR